MNNVIIGTAGHVDHGKTCLIKALTGIDTDRLKEEKKRGITIELGFAHLDFPSGQKVGIIDVPGHEKFVKNMLAGAGGIDIALLIVAANEGVMPQTREHFEILKLLDIHKGVIALTKADTVDAEFIEMIREDIAELVKGSFLEKAPVIETSVYTGTGIDKLKETLNLLVNDAEQKVLDKPFRIPVDRIFSVDGFGTVITGTLIDGIIKKGDSVSIYTSNGEARVRNIQVHDADVLEATAGQRVAVNLSGIKKEELKRGYVISAIDAMENTYIVDVKLDVLKDTKRSIKNGSRLHFYHGSRDVLCKVVLLDQEEVNPGESAYAQLRLEEEVALKYKDRYIVRFYSPLETVGGGEILNANPRKHQRHKEHILKALQVYENGTKDQVLMQMILDHGKEYPSLSLMHKKVHMGEDDFNRSLNELKDKGQVVIIAGDVVIPASHLEQLMNDGDQILSSFHQKNAFLKGMNPEEFKNKLFPDLNDPLMNDILDLLIDKKCICFESGYIKKPDFKVSFDNEQEKISKSIEKIYLEAGVLVPNRDDVLKNLKAKNAGQIMNAMITDGRLVMVEKQMLFHREVFEHLLGALEKYIAENGRITLGEFRDLIGASRKYAVAILEYLDSKKITKKIEDYRVLNDRCK